LNNTNVEIINNDFLNVDIKTLSENKMIFIGNLPYSVSTQMLIKIADNYNQVKHCIFMLQKEVAERICADTDSGKIYGAFSVLMQYRFKTEYLFNVSPNCFFPKPKVDSAVIKLSASNIILPEDFNHTYFIAFVRAAFANKRKIMINSLAAHLPNSKDFWKKLLNHFCLSESARAEEIKVEIFLEMFKKMETLMSCR